MLSKIIGLSLVCAVISCASDRGDGTNSPKIGVPLQEAYSVFTGAAGTAFNANEAVFLDDYSRTVAIFQVEPFAVIDTLKLPDSVDASAFFAGQQNQFFVLKEERGFGILKRDGQYIKNPVPMFGSLTSVSYDVASGRLVLQDDLESIALVILGGTGDVSASWVGGPIVDGANSIVAGTLLENGTLLASLSNKKLAAIDLDGSIAAGKWEFTVFDLALEQDLLWFSPVFNLEPVVIARTERAIMTIDVTQKKVIDSMQLTDAETGVHFNRSVGHVVVYDASGNYALVHSGESGKLVRKLIRNFRANIVVNDALEYSIMDQESGSLTIMATLDNKRTILRNRLSDGLFVGGVPVLAFERAIVTANYIIEVFNYRLGKAERRSITNPSDVVGLEAYNLARELNKSAR